MSRSSSWLSLLLLGLVLAATACTPSRGRSGTSDDDDSAGDDDDASDDDDAVADDDDDAVADDDDDDDDTVADDDDATPPPTDDDDATEPEFDFNQIQFSFAVTATPNGDLADLEATFFFTYLVVDSATGTGEVTCNQRVAVEGVGEYGFGVLADCSNCTGLMTFDPSTALDVSNPAVEPDDCDPQYLLDNDISMGLAMLNEFGSSPGYWPEADTGNTRNFGDFITIPTVDENTQLSLNWDGSATGAADLSASGNADWALNTYGAEFTHVGLVNGVASSGTLAGESGIGQVANPVDVGGDWFFYFVIAKDPSTNVHEGPDMQGDYLGFARFVITFGA